MQHIDHMANRHIWLEDNNTKGLFTYFPCSICTHTRTHMYIENTVWPKMYTVADGWWVSEKQTGKPTHTHTQRHNNQQSMRQQSFWQLLFMKCRRWMFFPGRPNGRGWTLTMLHAVSCPVERLQQWKWKSKKVRKNAKNTTQHNNNNNNNNMNMDIPSLWGRKGCVKWLNDVDGGDGVGDGWTFIIRSNDH